MTSVFSAGKPRSDACELDVAPASDFPVPASRKRIVGMIGEEIAAAYLRSIGYRIRGRNVRLRRDEIDLVAFDPADRALVFIEVKARSWRSWNFRPELNLTARKREKMRRAARRWVALHEYEGGYRIDLVCVAGGRVVDHFRRIGSDD